MNLSKDKTLDLVSRCGDGEEDALRQFFEIYSGRYLQFPNENLSFERRRRWGFFYLCI